MSLETKTKPLVEVKDYLDKLLNVGGMEADSNGLVVGGKVHLFAEKPRLRSMI